MALRFLVVTILISSQLNPQFILFSTSEMNIHLFSADGNYEVRYKSNVLKQNLLKSVQVIVRLIIFLIC